MAAEFEINDIISNDALMAPLILKKHFEELLITLKKIKDTSTSNAKDLDVSTSTKKVSDSTIKLTKDQQEMLKIQNQLAAAVAKDNEAYRQQQKVIQDLNAQMKTKLVLGDKEATQVTKANSSLLQIEAALNANRLAYSKLTTEQERQSTEGKNLLKTIQDQSVAQDELRSGLGQYNQKVGDYVNSIIKANEKIAEQEKATKALITVQQQTNTSTEAGKKAYAELDKQIEANVKEINVYRKETGLATTSTKQLTKEVETVDVSFTDMTGSVSSISPELGSAGQAVSGLSKELMALAANPVGLVIVAIALALAGLARYFTSSSEGQDKWNKVLAIGGALLDQFLDLLESVGKVIAEVGGAIYDWLIDPTTKFSDLLAPLEKQLTDMWENPLKYIKQFGSYISDKLMTLFKPLITAAKGLGEIFTGEFSKGADTLKLAQQQLVDEVKSAYKAIKDTVVDAWNGTKKAMQEYFNEAERRAAIALKVAAEENQLRKDQIADIIDDSKTELKTAKDMQVVHDQLRNTDEKRLVALKEANKLLEDQAKGDIALAAEELKTLEDKIALEKLGLDTTAMEGKERRKIIDDAIAGGKIDYDNRQKIAELIAKVNSTETNFLDGQKRRLSEEYNLVKSIHDAREAQVKAEQTAYENLNKWRLENTIALNKKIIDDEFSTIGTSTKALMDAQEARIKLTQDAAEKEKQVSLDAAKQRVQLSDDELKQIYGNKKLSLDEQLALDDKFRTEDAAKDKAYLDDITKITDKAGQDVLDIIDQTNQAAEDNVFKILARDAKKLDDVLSANTNKRLAALEEEFAAGKVSYKKYQKDKVDIQRNGDIMMLQEQLDALKMEAANLTIGSQQQLDILKKASEVELQLDQTKNELKVQYEQDLQQALNDLKTQGTQAAIQIVENAFDQESQDIQARLDYLDKTQQQELAMAGNNEAAKAAINNKFAAEKNKLQLQQAANDRKRAVFEKTAAAISIAINTAKGIGYALGTYPPPASFILAGVTAVLGAIQLAAVLSKPIPSYAVGTDNHPGGLAWVGEEGSEMYVTPDGKLGMTEDHATLMDLPAGTQVKTHQETVKALAYQAVSRQPEIAGKKEDVAGMNKVVSEIKDLKNVVKNKKEQHWNISKQGMQQMVKTAETRQYFMDYVYR